MDSLPLEIVGEIARFSRAAYLGLVRSYPKFARSLCLGDRLDYAESFGYDVHVLITNHHSDLCWTLNGELHRTDGHAREFGLETRYCSHGRTHRVDGPAFILGNQKYTDWVRANPRADPTRPPGSISADDEFDMYHIWFLYGIRVGEHWHALFTMTG